MNTIYDNTFVLGQTSATNFIAGNGITIDSPSAGTVRIGTDETVLFETTALNVSAASLSEPLSAFERFRLYPYQEAGGYYYYGEFDYNIVQSLFGSNNIRLLFNRCIGGNNPLQFLIAEYQLSNDRKSITGVTGYRRWFPMSNAAGGSDSGNTYIRKVVGINRISGGNA